MTSPWKPFDTAYAGYGQMKTWPRPKRRPKARRTSSRRDAVDVLQRRSKRLYYLDISPVGRPTLRLGCRKVTYRVGLRLVYWLRSRGHSAFMY